MNNAKRVLSEEHDRSLIRRRLLEKVKDHLEDAEVVDAVGTLALVVEMLSSSEERVMRLHAECVAMIEHAGKVLEMEHMRRPLSIQVTVPSPGGGKVTE